MNKYQEALNRVEFEALNKCMGYGLNEDNTFVCKCGKEPCEIAKDLKTLQELVDKATPKKGYMKAMDGFDADVASHLVCPSCEQPIVNVWTSRKYEPRYCHYCGQKFNWSSEVETDE